MARRKSRSATAGGFGAMVTAVAAGLAATAVGGCVERTVTINTEPSGATVLLNDEEVGKSPVRVPFTWYGDYDIVLRKTGYETVRTHRKIEAPWYQWPVIDLFAECLVPFTIYDERELETFVLAPRPSVDREALMQSAEELRERALSSTP